MSIDEGQRAAPTEILKGAPDEEVYCKICDKEIGRALVTFSAYIPGGMVPREVETRREWVHVETGLRHCHPVAEPALETDIAPGRSYVGRHNTRELLEREQRIESGLED